MNAEYEPLQLPIAQRVGLRIPRTLITNDHAAAVEFAESVGGPVICKTLSSMVLAEGGQHRITYATKVDVTDIAPASFGATAHCLQEWVPKRYDVRVTMVGGRALAVAIHTSSPRAHVAWRTDYDALRYVPIDVPTDVQAGMKDYLSAFGLSYGAFDFVVSPEEEWIMLECNPAGRWLWLEHQAGLPIAGAIAELLSMGAAQ